MSTRGARAAVSAIAKSLDHEQANLRKEAAAALGEIADTSARTHLEDHADDPDPDVRKNVQWALKRIGEGHAARS